MEHEKPDIQEEQSGEESAAAKFDTFASCQGCPMREVNCHSRCFGYAYRSAMDQKRRDERALKASANPKPSESEMMRRARRLKNGMRRIK